MLGRARKNRLLETLRAPDGDCVAGWQRGAVEGEAFLNNSNHRFPATYRGLSADGEYTY